MNCPKCGAAGAGGASYCVECGAEIEAKPIAESTCGVNEGKGFWSAIKARDFKAVAGKIKDHWKLALGIGVVILTILANVFGSDLDEKAVSNTILEIVNEQLLSSAQIDGVKATEVASLDLEKKGKRWLGTAAVEFKRGSKVTIETMKVDVTPKEKGGDAWIQVSFEDVESADYNLRRL